MFPGNHDVNITDVGYLYYIVRYSDGIDIKVYGQYIRCNAMTRAATVIIHNDDNIRDVRYYYYEQRLYS